jgi:hypothetical protein
MRWILQGWPPEEKRLALACDASTLGQRFTVLVISVVYRGCGIPVAWKVVSATTRMGMETSLARPVDPSQT